MEIVSLRVSAIGRLPKPEGNRRTGATASASRRGIARSGWTARWREIVAVWNRGRIARDMPLTGPAVIEEAYTTVLLADGWTCRRDDSGHLIAERVQP